MSCIAELYIVPTGFRDGLVKLKQETATKGVLFFTRQVNVEVKRVDTEYLENKATSVEELNYSGFFVSRYLEEILGIWETYFSNLDDYGYFLSYEKAVELKGYLAEHPPKEENIATYCKKEMGSKEADLKDDVETFVSVHNSLVTWVSKITPNDFGIIYLSY